MERFGLREEVFAFIVGKAEEFNMSKVILFGSRARGTQSKKSDIDIAFEGPAPDAFMAALDEQCPTLLQFDFIDLSKDIGTGLRQRINDEGVQLYGKV